MSDLGYVAATATGAAVGAATTCAALTLAGYSCNNYCGAYDPYCRWHNPISPYYVTPYPNVYPINYVAPVVFPVAPYGYTNFRPYHTSNEHTGPGGVSNPGGGPHGGGGGGRVGGGGGGHGGGGRR
jgi:uncharacterized membrane protein YgcG